MAPRTITRSLFAYAIHGHTRHGVLDYPAFFAMLSELPFTSRRVSVRDQITVIASLDQDKKVDPWSSELSPELQEARRSYSILTREKRGPAR